MLKHGSGRAVLFLQERPDTVIYRSVIWGACSENWSFDSQLEDERSPYLYDVIRATRDTPYYVGRIKEVLDTLGSSREPENLFPTQLIRLAALLTRRGAGDLREPMYRTVGTVAEETYGIAHIAENIIALDGVTGYWHLVEHVRHHSRRDDDRWREVSLIDELAEQFGESVATAALRASAQNNSERSQYLREIQTIRKRQKFRARLKRRKSEKKPPPLAEVRAYIYSSPEKKIPKPQMKYMNEAVRRRLWSDFKQESDCMRQLRYLGILRTYRYVPFPGDPEVIIPLIRQTDDERLAWQAVRLLVDTNHTTIRAAALDLMKEEKRVPHAIELLASNPGDGDVRLLESVIQREWDDRAFEFIGMGIRQYIRNSPSPGFVPILLLCYEKLACSFCRGQIVEMLLQRDALPNTIREECHFDADSDTRALFRPAPR
ncbi:MAG: hypothetical protein H8F28_21035 [Fibrella sp.]|nr:hypothetical protein [Armatimonadota bacterium]